MNNCYVVSQKSIYKLPTGVDKDNTLFFPETIMSLHDMMHTGRPDGYNIITDCPYLVPLYEARDVFVWNVETQTWDNPDFNTYGTSYEVIKSRIFKFDNTIPQAVIDGGITNVMGRKLCRKQ